MKKQNKNINQPKIKALLQIVKMQKKDQSRQEDLELHSIKEHVPGHQNNTDTSDKETHV